MNTVLHGLSPTVADRVVERLRQLGISTLFGVHGANAEDIFDATVRHPGITPVIAKHEFAAGAMADGAARIGGGVSAVLTTSGGGALNVVPALAEAYDSRVPVLALLGTAPRPTVGRGGFQDMLTPPDTIDLAAVLSGVVGAYAVVDDPGALDGAFTAVTDALRRGLPAALVIPKDVQAAPAPDVATTSPPHPRRAAEPAPDDLAERLAELAGAGRICVWAGEEASRLRLRDRVEALAALVGATVVVAPGGRDLAVPGRCAGVTGVMGHPSAHRALAAADLWLVLGCRMSLTDRAGLDALIADTETVHVGSWPPRTPGVTDHVPCDDLRGFLDSVIERTACLLTAPPPRPTVRLEHLSTPATAHPLDMRTVIDTIGAHLPPGCAVFADAGNTGAASIHYLPFGDHRFEVALGMGGMGHAIGAGLGTALDTGTRTVVIAGDGAFFMHGMELHTAAEYDAPLTLVVLNNNAHAMCVTRERLYFPDTPGLNRFGPADIAAGAAAMFPAIKVFHATDAAGLAAACPDALTAAGPTCLVIDVDPDEIPPFAPFL